MTTTLYKLQHISMNSDEQIPSPPPPTPSNHSVSLSSDKSDPFLSHLLNRLTIISPLRPLRPKPKTLTLIPPLISLVSPNEHLILSAATELGFFHISDSNISESLYESSLLRYKSNSMTISDTSALGFNSDRSNDGECIHVYDTNGTDEPYARELKRIGLKVLESLRFKKQTTRCFMWVSLKNESINENFPYILSLQYEGKGKKGPSRVMDDSDEWVPIAVREEAVLVTLGDIAQVWSNGKFKKVRGLPQPSSSPIKCCTESTNTSMTLLITVPMESTISPLVPSKLEMVHEDGISNDVTPRFRAFPMEEYSRKVYHEGVQFKDPLAPYWI